MSRTIAAGSAGGLAQSVPAPRRLALAKFLRVNFHGPLLAGLVMLVAILAIAAFAPAISPYNPIEQHLDQAFLQPGNPGHLLGTDNFGRDILSRIIYGTRLDLQIGFLSVLFPFIAGSLIGVTTGYLGGKTDIVVMRIVDILMAFPFLVLI